MAKYQKIFLAEKPDIGRALAAYLWQGDCQKGKGFLFHGDTAVTWAFGHILGLAPPEDYGEEYKAWKNYPILPQKWKLKPAANCREQLAVIKGLLAETATVIHAGDPDREGQLLIDEILHYLNFRGNVQRILIHAKDDESLKRAFASITDNKRFENLYYAGLGRERADWLIGMNLTRAYTVNARKYGFDTTFRIGRVKVPTLALVVRREKEIRGFRSVNFYELQGSFIKDGISFKARWNPKEELLDENGHLRDKQVADAVRMKLETAAVAVIKTETKSVVQHPPLPYSLDTLQVDANKKYKLSPKEVLDTVQTLYEGKLVSYPRSDCNYLPVSQKADAGRILPMLASLSVPGAENADEGRSSKAFNDSKITAHHAIIPTGVMPDKLEGTEEKIYQLIAKRYVLQFFPPHEFKKVMFTLQAGDEIFMGSGKIVTELGFRQFEQEREQPEEGENFRLPNLQEGDSIEQYEYSLQSKKTTPPKRFTEGTLLAAMANIWRYVAPDNPNRDKLKEVKGIGTPATRDTIISELQADTLKGKPIEPCMKKVKNELQPTPFGMSLIDNVDKSLTVPDTTAEMEYALSEIAEGRKSLSEYNDELLTMLHANLQYAEQRKFPVQQKDGQQPCPICKKGFLVRKYSPKTEKHFHVCSDPACVSPITGRKMFFEDDGGKPIIVKCPSCGEILVHILKNGSFWLCSKCNKTYNEVAGKPDFTPRKK